MATPRVSGLLAASTLALAGIGCDSCLSPAGGSPNPPQATLTVDPGTLFPGILVRANACGSLDLDGPPAGYCFSFGEWGAPVVVRPAEASTPCAGDIPPAPDAAYTYLIPGAPEVRLVVFDDACPMPLVQLDDECGIDNLDELLSTRTACSTAAAAVIVSVLDPPESGVESGLGDASDAMTETCFPDAFEPNDGMTMATPVTAGTFDNLNICIDDVDFIALDLIAGFNVRATIIHDPSEGDLDAIIFDAEGDIVEVASTLDPMEVAQFFVAADGVHLLQIYGFGGQRAAYQLVIEIF